MVQRASTEARESRMPLGIGYTGYQSGYNKLFTQVIRLFLLLISVCVCLWVDMGFSSSSSSLYSVFESCSLNGAGNFI